MKNAEHIAIVGSGAVASALAIALHRKKFTLTLIGRNIRTVKSLAKKVNGNAVLIGKMTEKHIAGIVFIAVPDRAIAGVVQTMRKCSESLTTSTIFHLSGVLTSEALRPLKLSGAYVGSFHPMQTFPKGKTARLDNIWIAVEGDRKALQVSARLAKILHARTFIISKEVKVLYHTAAVFASNYLVTLLSVVEQIAEQIKIPPKSIWKIYQPIIEQTLHNVMDSSPAKALTGPITRGDVKTVTMHLQALSKKELNHLVPLYSVLGLETARLVKKQHR